MSIFFFGCVYRQYVARNNILRVCLILVNRPIFFFFSSIVVLVFTVTQSKNRNPAFNQYIKSRFLGYDRRLTYINPFIKIFGFPLAVFIRAYSEKCKSPRNLYWGFVSRRHVGAPRGRNCCKVTETFIIEFCH